MKQYLKYITTIIVMAIVVFEIIVLGILKFPEGVFYSSYQSVIVDKYRMLQNTDEPKIIIVAGSSGAFGLDQKMLEEATGYKVVNLGLHAAFGHLFHTELAKENINEGDIVLLGYEYDWQSGFDMLGQDLIMSGIDDNIDMYTHIPIRKWPEFIGYIFKYAEKKNTYQGPTFYARDIFDETGQMTVDREYVMNYSENSEKHGAFHVRSWVLTEDTVEYLKDFKKYVENKGANVYFISPPLIREAVICDYAEFDNLVKEEEEQIGIPYISNPTDYLFENELIFDTFYHCSTKGEKVRTQLLIGDLKRASIIDTEWPLPLDISFKSETNTAAGYTTSGFSDAESWGTWTSGKEAILSFNYLDAQSDLVLTLECPMSYGEQSVLIYANDVLIDEYVFSGNENRSIVIPKDCIQDDSLTIRFELPDAVSPKEKGESEDTRELAIGISRLTLERVE